MSLQTDVTTNKKHESIITILAYFAANRNFGYVDVLANSLDPLTAKETLINAARDFLSACDPTRPQKEAKDEVPCPANIKPEYLNYDIQSFIKEIESSWNTFFRLTRSVALRALAKAVGLRFTSLGSKLSQESEESE